MIRRPIKIDFTRDELDLLSQSISFGDVEEHRREDLRKLFRRIEDKRAQTIFPHADEVEGGRRIKRKESSD